MTGTELGEPRCLMMEEIKIMNGQMLNTDLI